MAESSDLIDWSAFDEFRGDGDFHIPSLLRELVSPDSGTRADARETIVQWPDLILRHIGRLGAIPHVLDIILQLAADPNVPDRADLLKLATKLARRAPDYISFTDWYRGSPDE